MARIFSATSMVLSASAKLEDGCSAGDDGIDELTVLGLEAAEDMFVVAAGDLAGIIDDALGVAVGVEDALVLVLGFDADARCMHLHAEDAPSAGPTVEHHAGGAVVELEHGRE